MNFTASDPVDALVVGARGGLGQAFVDILQKNESIGTVHALSRQPITPRPGVKSYGYTPDEDGLRRALSSVPTDRLRLAVVTIGTLHDESGSPEKSIRQFTEERFLEVIRINTILPALVGKILMPTLKQHPMILAALSARVGSISDNRLGGWHSYRASKAALNMIMRNIALEAGRSNPESIVVTLHPGTVDTDLSKPFQKNVAKGKLFTPEHSARSLFEVMTKLTPSQTGKNFDYAGKEIDP